MSVLAVLLACVAQDPCARVHDALFLRTAPDGKTYGAAELDPPLYPDSRWLLEPPKQKPLLEALDALHASDLRARPVRERVVLQRDLWQAYDWLFERQPDGPLAAPLARALRDLAPGADELRALRTDAAGIEGLPAGVLDATQGWVRLADAQGRTITPAHEAHRGARSRFEVLLRLPGGRETTLAWLEKLRALPDPLTGAEDERRFRADLPGLPPGTEVALVRRALALCARGELVASDLVESVQLRRFLVEDPSGRAERFSMDLSKAQEVALFRIDRSGAHALRALGPDEYDFDEFGRHGEDPFEGTRETWGWRKPGLVRCAGCHAQPGIYSVNSFTRMSSGPGTILAVRPHDRPSVFVEADPAKLAERALLAARDQDSFRALLAGWKPAPR
jgi:hypothetical protein